MLLEALEVMKVNEIHKVNIEAKYHNRGSGDKRK